MESRKINDTFKILSALGIIFVVAGHCGGLGLSLAYEWFTPYSFHLALFVFISGYFYSDANEEKIPAYFRKKIRKLMIPTFLWNIAYGISAQFLKKFEFTMGGGT